MDTEPEPECLIEKLFVFCLESFDVVISLAKSSPSARLRKEWRDERGRFVIWGDGVAVQDGALAERLRNARELELRQSVIIALATMAHTFGPAVRDSRDRSDKLQYLLRTSQTYVPEVEGLIGFEASYLDLEDLIEEIGGANDSLCELVPFLEDILEVGFSSTSFSGEEQQEFEPDHAAKTYERNILDNFPVVEKSLAKCLAILNWKRHQNIRELALSQHSPAEELELDSVALLSSEAAKTDAGFSGTAASTRYDSIFDNDDSKSIFSATSYGTPVAEESAPVTIPPPPVELRHDVEFECNICFKTQRGIYNMPLWREHVLEDLQPYSCTFTACPEREKMYGSSQKWAAHEFQYHRCVSEWVCIGSCGTFSSREEFITHIREDHLKLSDSNLDIEDIVDSRERKRASDPTQVECPFCLETIWETSSAVQEHIGRHFESIALKALLPELYDVRDYSAAPIKHVLLTTRRELHCSSDEEDGGVSRGRDLDKLEDELTEAIMRIPRFISPGRTAAWVEVSATYLHNQRRSSSGSLSLPLLSTQPQLTTEHQSRSAISSDPRMGDSVHQSPPPANGGLSIMPAGAIMSQPDSTQNSSDEEDGGVSRGRDLDKLEDELTEAIMRIPRFISPERTAASVEVAVATRPRSGSNSGSVSDFEDDYRIAPPVVRKKSGEVVKSSLKAPSRSRPCSVPAALTFPKNVNFDARIEHVRHFLHSQKPSAVSRGSPPVEDNYDGESEYPFGYGDEPQWEIGLPNFPKDHESRKVLPVPLEKLSELLADERCRQAVHQFFATTDVGRTSSPRRQKREKERPVGVGKTGNARSSSHC